MSNTKASIEAHIDSIDTGGNNTASEVRDVFKTNADSILETIYPNVLTGASATALITQNKTGPLKLSITKQGRFVTLSGNYIASENVSAGHSVLSINNSDYSSIILHDNIGVSSINGSPAFTCVLGAGVLFPISGTSNQLTFSQAILSGENVVFQVTYETLN